MSKADGFMAEQESYKEKRHTNYKNSWKVQSENVSGDTVTRNIKDPYNSNLATDNLGQPIISRAYAHKGFFEGPRNGIFSVYDSNIRKDAEFKENACTDAAAYVTFKDEFGRVMSESSVSWNGEHYYTDGYGNARIVDLAVLERERKRKEAEDEYVDMLLEHVWLSDSACALVLGLKDPRRYEKILGGFSAYTAKSYAAWLAEAGPLGRGIPFDVARRDCRVSVLSTRVSASSDCGDLLKLRMILLNCNVKFQNSGMTAGKLRARDRVDAAQTQKEHDEDDGTYRSGKKTDYNDGNGPVPKRQLYESVDGPAPALAPGNNSGGLFSLPSGGAISGMFTGR